MPITSSGSKPITDQDLGEILTLSQKGPLPKRKLLSFDTKPIAVAWMVWSVQKRNRCKNFERWCQTDIFQNSHFRRSEESNRLFRLWWNILQGRFENSGNEIRTITNDCGGSSWKTFEFSTSQNAQFRKHYQFRFLYIQSCRCFKIVRIWERLEEYIGLNRVTLTLPPNMK